MPGKLNGDRLVLLINTTINIGFLDLMWKAQTITEKDHKCKIIDLWKVLLRKLKDKASTKRKYLQNILDKEFVSIMYKELLKLND